MEKKMSAVTEAVISNLPRVAVVGLAISVTLGIFYGVRAEATANAVNEIIRSLDRAFPAGPPYIGSPTVDVPNVATTLVTLNIVPSRWTRPVNATSGIYSAGGDGEWSISRKATTMDLEFKLDKLSDRACAAVVAGLQATPDLKKIQVGTSASVDLTGKSPSDQAALITGESVKCQPTNNTVLITRG
jgi:hypothetical protein